MAAALASRARGAVVGGLVADAAAVPCHWCYDTTKLAEHLKTARRGPAFCDPPGNVFYTPPPGGFSCYGDQTMTLLESLVACEGKLDVEDYATRLESKFGKASAYEVEAVDPENWPELKTNPTDADGNVIEAERKWSMPLPGPWRHGSIKKFLKQRVVEKKQFPECGAADEQVDGCCKVAPLVALLAGSQQLLPSVDTAVRVTQNTDKASAFACGFARVLEKLVLGTPTVSEAISAAQADLANPERAFKTALDDDVAANLGRVVGEFSGMPHIEEPDYKQAVEESIRTGGCTASRATLAGACYGSIGTDLMIPEEWIANTSEGARLKDLVAKLVDLREKVATDSTVCCGAM